MKYNPFLLSILTALLMACSHSGGGPGTVIEPEEPPVETGTPIVFAAEEQQEGSVTRSQTRTTGLEEETTSFTVWGYKNMEYDAGSYGGLQKVFPGYTVTYEGNSAGTTTSNSHDWEYVRTSPTEQTIKYWDWSARAYRFFGVTGTAASNADDQTEHPEKYLATGTTAAPALAIAADASSTSAISATPYYSHMWFSTGNTTDYPTRPFGQAVQLEFLKPYSRVRFMFTFGQESIGIIIGDKDFRPTTDNTYINIKGTVTITYPLTGTETQEQFEVSNVTSTIDAFTITYDPQTDSGWYTVLPNDHQGPYTLTVNVNGSDKTCVVPAAYMQWQPGYSYTYVFKINEEGGVEIEMVQSAVTPWLEDIPGSKTVYNW